MRVAAHLHTSHSWDSWLSPRRLVRTLVDAGVELALITDHDSFAGSLEAQEYIAREGIDMMVPTAAEIRTEVGDVVLVLPTADVPPASTLKTFDGLCETASRLQGLIWLPHPYRHHPVESLPALASASDVIEVFNARCDERENALAAELCAEHGKVPAFGMDAHGAAEAGRWSVEYDRAGEPLEVLKQTPRAIQIAYSRPHEFHMSEAIYSMKELRRDLAALRLRPAARHTVRAPYHALQIPVRLMEERWARRRGSESTSLPLKPEGRRDASGRQ